MTELVLAPDANALAKVAAERLSALTLEFAGADGRINVVLSGGRTPRRCFELLAQDPARPAARWDAWLADERCVPPGDPASNHQLLVETLVDAGALAAEHCHRVPTEYGHLRAATSYAMVFPPWIDILVLGLGDDGHTASLFPGSTALDEKRERIVAVTGPKAPRERVTITPPVIAAATNVIVLVSGAEKAEILAAVLEGPYDPAALPAQLARRGTWIIDAAAAAQLKCARG